MGGIVSKPEDISIPSNNYLPSSNVSLGVSHTFPFPFFYYSNSANKTYFSALHTKS